MQLIFFFNKKKRYWQKIGLTYAYKYLSITSWVSLIKDSSYVMQKSNRGKLFLKNETPITHYQVRTFCFPVMLHVLFDYLMDIKVKQTIAYILNIVINIKYPYQ